MLKILPTIFSTVIYLSALAQNDTLFVKTQSNPIIGNVDIDYKKHTVKVKTAEKKPASFQFGEVLSIRSDLGKYSVSRIVGDQPDLLVLMVQGKYSLLYQEKKKIFYIEKNDSLKIISRKHINQALPLIFDAGMLDTFHRKMNLHPDYSFKYLRKLTVYANESAGGEAVVNEQNFKNFKVIVEVGPYVGIESNTTNFVDVAQNQKTFEYFKTGKYNARNVSLGARFSIAVSPKISFAVNTYFKSTSFTNLSNDDKGLAQLLMVSFFSIPRQYGKNLKLESFTYQSVNIDGSFDYSPIKRTGAKIRPYVSLGPSLVIMVDEKMVLGSRLNNQDQIDRLFTYHWNASKRKNMMVGYNCGLGANIQLQKQLTLNIFGKFQQGRFPRIIHRPKEHAVENPSDMIPSENRFEYSYDQYSKTLMFGAAIMYRL